MTRRQICIRYFKEQGAVLSCQDVCKLLIKNRQVKRSAEMYLSGGVSTILRRLVKDGRLVYAEGTGPKGGHLYKLKEGNV